MARKKPKRQTRFVIFAAPEVRQPPYDHLVSATDGTTTKSRSRYKTFHTEPAARKFAQDKSIELDGAMQYIGLLDFDESELRDEN